MHSVSFSSPDAKVGARTAGGRRKGKKPCPEDLEEARHRTIYVSDLNKGITETELVRWFGVAGHVLECRICSDMNTSKRFAFVEFADKEGFDQGALPQLASRTVNSLCALRKCLLDQAAQTRASHRALAYSIEKDCDGRSACRTCDEWSEAEQQRDQGVAQQDTYRTDQPRLHASRREGA